MPTQQVVSVLSDAPPFNGVLSVQVNTTGILRTTIEAKLAELAVTADDVQTLVVTGIINGAGSDNDLAAIKTLFQNRSLKSIDLSNSELSGPITAYFGGIGTTAQSGALKGLERIVMPQLGESYALPANFLSGIASLTYADVSNATSFGDGTFRYSGVGNDSVVLPNSYAMGDNMFLGCTALTSFDASNVTSFGVGALSRTGISSVIFPQSYALSDSLFAYCSSLTAIDVSNATSIGAYLFKDCSNLTDITLPASSYDVGQSAFNGCAALTSIDASTATNFGRAAFRGCSSLAEIKLPESYPVSREMFMSCIALTSIDVSGATSIGADAFDYCSGLSRVKLPDNFAVPDSLFYYCTALNAVDLRGATSFGSSVFRGSAVRIVVMPTAATPPTNFLTGAPQGISFIVPDLAHYDTQTAFKQQVESLNGTLAQCAYGSVDKALGAGERLELSSPLEAEGLTYQWYKDGFMLDYATAATLSISEPNAACQGSYSIALCGLVLPVEYLVTIESIAEPLSPALALSAPDNATAGESFNAAVSLSLANQAANLLLTFELGAGTELSGTIADSLEALSGFAVLFAWQIPGSNTFNVALWAEPPGVSFADTTEVLRLSLTSAEPGAATVTLVDAKMARYLGDNNAEDIDVVLPEGEDATVEITIEEPPIIWARYDFNRDGRESLADLSAAQLYYHASAEAGGAHWTIVLERGIDLNEDGLVDIADYIIIVNYLYGIYN